MLELFLQLHPAVQFEVVGLGFGLLVAAFFLLILFIGHL
jgi:hypothetical protein